LAATVAFEEIRYGFSHIDLTGETADQGQPSAYYPEGELEADQDEELRRQLDDYNPDRELIALPWRGEVRADVNLVTRPPMGWYTEMRTQTPYQHRP
jgi:hypothetical protein